MIGLRGFTRRNLFRMRQFYATYQDDAKVPPLVTQLPWTHNLSFYLEALDRDVKKEHEHPAIGVLLCASKDEEVVEYAQLLEAKLQEFYLQCKATAGGDE